MKIIEAIRLIDSLKPNTYTDSEKVAWLSRLDGVVKRLIVDTHEGWEDVTFSGYDVNTDTQTEMLVPAPFDDIYLRWLEAQIDYANGEYEHYNNSITVYKDVYDGYANWYNRTHTPMAMRIKYF